MSDILLALRDSVFSVGDPISMEHRLARLVELARRLTNARYGALGIPDNEGDFARFVTSGMSDELVAAIGPLPRTHGLLGTILREGAPYRTADIGADPRFCWWPGAHPRMKSFLGVPIVREGRVIGAFYLTDREGGGEFTPADQEVVETLAGHAGLAIENARLYEQVRELSIVEERNRLARELHDSVTQTLFGLNLLAQAASASLDEEPSTVRARLQQISELAGAALAEMRSLVFELRPAELERYGLEQALRAHVEVLGRVHPVAVRLSVEGGRRVRERVEREVFRIAQEALSNAARHASAKVVTVELAFTESLVSLRVADDGVGFNPGSPDLRARHLGLTSMEERARQLGGRLRLESAPGVGTRVEVEVPIGEPDT